MLFVKQLYQNWIEALIYEYNPSTKKPYSVVACKVKEVTKRGIKVTDDTKEEWLIEKEDIVSFKVLEGQIKELRYNQV